MNTPPITFRIAAVCLSILLGGSYLAYRSWAARGGSGGGSAADFLPGPKSAPVDSTLLPGSKSAVPATSTDQLLLPGSKSIVPFTFPAQPQQQASPIK